MTFLLTGANADLSARNRDRGPVCIYFGLPCGTRIRFRLTEISRIPRLETVQKLFLRWHIFLPSCSDEPLPKR